MARVKFQDRLQRSFLGYAALIVAVIVALYLGGFLLNAYTVVIRGCRQGSREAETFLSAQLESYTGGMEMLAKQPELLAAAGGRQEAGPMPIVFSTTLPTARRCGPTSCC